MSETKTKIICTIGPAVDDEQAIISLIEAGMDLARLNFSHGSYDEHARRIANIEAARAATGVPIAIILDTKGPEIRIGQIEGGSVVLEVGAELRLKADGSAGTASSISQSFPDLAAHVSPGDAILLDDGLIELAVLAIEDDEVVCAVVNPGVLKPNKSLNVPGVDIPLPSITEKDERDILFGIERGIDFVAMSFVKDAAAVREMRSFLRQHAEAPIGIIAKVENAKAVANIDEIIEAADAIMVARGDLGVEMPPDEVPHIQKEICKKCNEAHKPVIIATQMLESMTGNPRPTRAEAADVANAVYDGADCIMLSGETAAGAYPIEAVLTMDRIARTSEAHYFENLHRMPLVASGAKSISHAVGIAAVQTANDIGAKCLICPTMTGRSARLVSSLRPQIPVYAVAPDARTQRSMQIFWGVVSFLGDVQGDMRHVIQMAEDVVIDQGCVDPGDIAVLTCGDRFTSPVKRHADGTVDRFAPANVMYVVQIRDEHTASAVASSGDDALMTPSFFSRHH